MEVRERKEDEKPIQTEEKLRGENEVEKEGGKKESSVERKVVRKSRKYEERRQGEEKNQLRQVNSI